LLLAVLTHQRAILAESTRWTRVALARTPTLNAVLPLSERAWSWSLSGALALALFEVLGANGAQRDWQRLYDLAVDAVWLALPDDQPRTARKSTDIDGFNDYPGNEYQDVAKLMDRAVNNLEPLEDT
jgi:hypothetical protein